MYTKEEREGILWEFRQSGLSVPEACRRLPLFPTRANLYRWLRMEEAGELAATEMPDRAARMHCAHGEGSPRYAARARRDRGEAELGEPEQTDWRDWGADLPDDPAERARMAEVKLAEALAESESPPFPLTLVLPFRHDAPNGERGQIWDTHPPSAPPSSSSGRRGSTASAAARTPSSPASRAATRAAYRTGSGGRAPRARRPTGTPSRWPGSRAGRGARTTARGPRTRYF